MPFEGFVADAEVTRKVVIPNLASADSMAGVKRNERLAALWGLEIYLAFVPWQPAVVKAVVVVVVAAAEVPVVSENTGER